MATPRMPMPVPGTWTPAQGIKFGHAMPTSTNTGQDQGPSGPKPGKWDPNQGIRFG